jgi:alkanesulfonate monooxygenase SsuD/methylene tetrahydromethanopterin reductase-like flavin-dependent oxidoreductase (luciferase family)
MLTAMAGATVQERSGGRLVLGLGTGPAVRGALDRLRSLVVGLQRLFREGEATIDGRRLRLSLPIPAPPPLWVAALGPKAMRLAGEVADGVILNWCTPERVAQARSEIAAGASSAGRDAAHVTLAVYVRAALGDHRSAARAAIKTAAAEYASYPAYARQFELMGLGEAAERASTAHREGRPTEVPDDLVEAVCLIGPPATARERLERYRAHGADLPVVYPVVGVPNDPRGRPGPGPPSRPSTDLSSAIGETLDRLAPGR